MQFILLYIYDSMNLHEATQASVIGTNTLFFFSFKFRNTFKTTFVAGMYFLAQL